MVSNYFSTHYRSIKRFNKIARIELSLVNLQLFTRVHPFFNNFKLLRRLTTVSSNFKLLNFDEPVLQIFISCCYNNDIKLMSNHC